MSTGTFELSTVNSQWRSRLIVISFAVALLITAAVLFLAIPIVQASMPGYSMGFADGYDLIAQNLVKGNGYRFIADMAPTMIREPAYPLFLAGIFKIGGHHIETARFANLLLAIGIAFLLMSLAQSVTGNRAAAAIATVLFLFYPGTLIAEARGGVEILFIFASLVFLLAAHRAVEQGGRWRYLVAGLALGAVLQVRSTPLVFPALLLGYLLVITKGKRQRFRAVSNVAVLVTGMAIVVAPWAIRNYRLVHHFVPLSTVLGLNLQEGQYTCQTLPFGGDFARKENEAARIRRGLANELGFRFVGSYYFQAFYDPQDEWAFANALVRRAVAEYASEPSLVAECAAKNAFNFWFLGKTWQVTKLNMLLQIPICILTITGLYLLWRGGLMSKMGIILVFALSILMVHLPVVAEARHSIPVIALMTIPASVSIIWIWQKYGPRTQRGTR